MSAGRIVARTAAIGVVLALVGVVAAPPAYADVPGEGIVTDLLGGAVGWAFDEVADGITRWVLGAVAFFVEGALNFLRSSGRPEVDADWFAGPGSPFAAVRNIAAVLLLAFALLGVLQGLLHGDAGLMVRQVVGKLPVAVVGMVVTTSVVVKLLDLTDALSAAVLATTDEQALHFLSGFGLTIANLTSGFAAVVLGLVAVLAALVLWIELIVRASLVYLLVAISPLGFAAMLWPSARGFLRRTVEILLAVILSKFVIAVALSIGVAALSGAGDSTSVNGTDAGLGALLVGTVVLGLAAFSPFIVLKLVPVAEGALVAHGVSRGPFRAAHSGASTYWTVDRLAGSGRRVPSAPRAAPSSAGGAATGSGVATSAATGGAGFAAGAATTTFARAATAARRTASAADASASRARRDDPPARSAPPRTEDDRGRR